MVFAECDSDDWCLIANPVAKIFWIKTYTERLASCWSEFFSETNLLAAKLRWIVDLFANCLSFGMKQEFLYVVLQNELFNHCQLDS